MVDFAARLIRTPSQGGVDSPRAVLELAARELGALGLRPALLANDEGQPVALAAEVAGARAGPTWVLDACIDTAPVGDRAAWSIDPFAGLVRDGWLWGRGAADSKIGVATMALLGAAMAKQRDRLAGTLVVLFDADEHTGRFGGIKRFMRDGRSIAGVMIGYPENDAVFIGARGFWRAEIEAYGRAEHSGATGTTPCNAAVKLAALIGRLAGAPLPAASDPGFPLPPKLTVTAIGGGEGFSVVPDAARLKLDVRLTPAFGKREAESLVRAQVEAIDAAHPAPRPSRISLVDSWGPYRLDDGEPLARAVLAGARTAKGVPVSGDVCGPSNIANFLADLGVPATCGFGVTCHGVHGADERAEIATVPLAWTAYGEAVLALMR
ncbi:MAG: M20/M25/M40 family metallo-hydrolase [Alphaproteobacteria bacterium]|nr:M20/M25/M40 family metallo-hydrolase [Alphaproteobacteria bacterium]